VAVTPPASGVSGEGRGRRLASLALQLVLTVVVTVFVTRQVGLGVEDLRALDPAIWTPRWGVFALSCGLLLAGYLASAALWGILVAELGGPRLGATAVVPVFLVANLGRYLPGKLWQIAGLAVLALRLGVPASVSTAAAVLGQAMALGGAVLVGSLALMGREESLGGWSLLSLVVVAGVLAVALLPPLQRRAVRIWYRLARHPGEQVAPGAGSTLRWLVLYTLNWVLYAGSFWVLARSLELPGSALEVGSAFAAAYVLGYLALFAPAGIGVREGFLVLFLSPAMGAGPAGALAIVARVWTTGVEVIPALLLWGRSLMAGDGPPAAAGEGSR